MSKKNLQLLDDTVNDVIGPQDITLTEDESEIMLAYQDQIQAIAMVKQQEFNQLVAPIEDKKKKRAERICQRLGLPGDAIGTTHTLDIRENGVVLVEKPS